MTKSLIVKPWMNFAQEITPSFPLFATPHSLALLLFLKCLENDNSSVSLKMSNNIIYLLAATALFSPDRRLLPLSFTSGSLASGLTLTSFTQIFAQYGYPGLSPHAER